MTQATEQVEAAPAAAESNDTPPPLLRIVEAMLFVGGEPLQPASVIEVVRGVEANQVLEILKELNRRYEAQKRPYHVEERPDGYVLVLRPRFHEVAQRLEGGVKEARLSRAAIETLAIVAYRQPVGKADVDSLRGQDSGSWLRSLIRRDLIHVSEDSREAGETLYVTTPRFLEVFHLTSLNDLPRTGDLTQI